jgi:hypothetical protein
LPRSLNKRKLIGSSSPQETYITKDKDEVSKVEMLLREGLVVAPSLGRARGVLTFFSNSLYDNVLYYSGSADGMFKPN